MNLKPECLKGQALALELCKIHWNIIHDIVPFHMFADDPQVHTSIDASSIYNQLMAKGKIKKNCLHQISSLMTENRLKLNLSKN